MSDSTRDRFNEKEGFQVLCGKGNPGESSCQQNSRWMAHWTRASSSAYGKSCSPLEDADNSTCTKDYGTSLFELKNSSVAERLMSGGNYEGISMKSMQQLNSNMWGVAHEAEQKKIAQRDGSFHSSVVQMQRDENFYAKTVVSETLSVRRLPDLPFDFQKLVSSGENLDTHLNQLPMLSINQKVDSILNPKRRYATGTVFSDLFVPQQTPMLNVAPSNLMEQSHQVYELQSHPRTGRIMDHCKPAGGIIRLREDPTCLTSDPPGKKLKFDNKSLSDCLIDEQDTCRYFANSNQEPVWKCSGKTFNLSENNDKGQSVGGASQNQKSRTLAGLRERQPQEEFIDSSKEKIPCLFEMLTTPSNLESSYAKDSLYSGTPNGFGVCLYGPNIDSHLFGDHKKMSPTTEKLHGDAQYVSKSSAGITSLLAQKDNNCAEKANEQLATLSIKGSPGHDEENRPGVNQDISSKQDLRTPDTDIMDLDPLPLEPSTARNQVPNRETQSPTRADPSYRWLKRLRHDVSDHPVPGSKSPKTGDCHPVGGASRMSDTDITDHVTARSIHCWLGRWCLGGGGAPASDGDPDQRRRAAAAKPDVATGELGVGRLFPSIKAMAMMGRVMSKVRPLDRQKNGPCVMWKTEGV